MIKRKPLHPINFEGCLHRAMEEIVNNGLSYATVTIKVFAGTEILIPTIKPANKADGINAPTEVDERIIAHIRQMAKEKDDIYLGDGQLHQQAIPKKNIDIVVSVPLKQQLEKENLIVSK